MTLLTAERLKAEVLVIDGQSTDGTREAATALRAHVVDERRKGYAAAIATGFAEGRPEQHAASLR